MKLSTIPPHLSKPRTIAELCDHVAILAKDYYQSPPEPGTGKRHPTGEALNVRTALRVLSELFPDKSPAELTARDFYDCQQHLLHRRIRKRGANSGTRPLKRRTINDYMGCIGRVLRAVSHPLIGWVPASVVAELAVVPPLPCNRTQALESEPIEPVSVELVTATMAAVPPTHMHVYLMLDLLLCTGMRCSELIRMKRSELVVEQAQLATGRRVELMVYKPWRHKTRHYNIPRNIFFGPEARRILEDRMRQVPPDQEKLWPYQDTKGFRQMIYRINHRADIPRWKPGQIRHTYATRMRAESGLDVAQVLLGHKHRTTTEIYAKPDASAAIEAILRFG